MGSTRINYDRKYLRTDKELIEGRLYVVTSNNLSFLKNRINSTWTGHNETYNYEDNFTDSFPFVAEYQYVYDLGQQMEDNGYAVSLPIVGKKS